MCVLGYFKTVLFIVLSRLRIELHQRFCAFDLSSPAMADCIDCSRFPVNCRLSKSQLQPVFKGANRRSIDERSWLEPNTEPGLVILSTAAACGVVPFVPTRSNPPCVCERLPLRLRALSLASVTFAEPADC